MDYSFKPTTNGRKALTACMDLAAAPNICRVAFGSGLVAEDVNLADQHSLVAYVADGTIASRRHQDDHFYFTIQYANNAHQDVETFYLSEFIVYIRDPDTGEETDLLYGTLGDYRLPVPKYHAGLAPSVFDLPLVLVVSDEVSVEVSAPPGLVTYEDLENAVEQAVGDMADCARATVLQVTIPAEGWTETTREATEDAEGGVTAEDTEGGGMHVDVSVPEAKENLVPFLTIYPADMDTARSCAMSTTVRTLDGVLRVYARSAPSARIRATLALLGAGGSTAAIGGGTATEVGRGLTVSTDGKLEVKAGDGLTFDASGAVAVDAAGISDETAQALTERLAGTDAEAAAAIDEAYQ